MRDRRLIVPLVLGLLFAVIPNLQLATDAAPFLTGDRCVGCHQGVQTSAGLDVSIGLDWRGSMMANAGRDPYWQAAVRREITDHPEATEAIEDKCSRCHMPMANELQRRADGTGSVFANLPGGPAAPGQPAGAASAGPAAPVGHAALAADGVSCSACHQIQPEGLGTEDSYVGGWEIALQGPANGRSVFGPFEPDAGGVGIMHSATGYRPTQGNHIQSSELCATCHTLFTHAIRDGAMEGPEFPEQVPYQEWAASAYAGDDGRSCQDCHMPVVDEPVPVTGVLGQPRDEVSRHVFRGGNFLMLRMLNRYRGELGVVALPQELTLAADRAVEHLRTSTARVSVVEDATVEDGTLRFDVTVANLAGHKFPTAYPSRRAWLAVRVVDAGDRVVFESGAFRPDGSITGNDNDVDGSRYEPHYAEIDDPDQVQIYEAVMVDQGGAVTTGLMEAERWIKDNRLLPDGFDPTGSESRIGVFGRAGDDEDFRAGGDVIRYRVDVDSHDAPFTVTAELWFQPIAYRWAENLAAYDAFETSRFVGYYRAMASGSAIPVARAEHVVR